MTYAYEDTTREALDVQLEGYRRMSGQQRLAQSTSMTRRLRQMAWSAIRRRHPDWDEEQIRLEFIQIVYGETIAEMVQQNCR